MLWCGFELQKSQSNFSIKTLFENSDFIKPDCPCHVL